MNIKKAPTRERKDKTDAWPFIRWIESRQRWMVDARTATGGERKFFAEKGAASGFAQAQLVRRESEGGAAFDETGLAKYGWTVARAITFALEHLARQSASVPIDEAVQALRDHKMGRVGEKRGRDLKNRLARFTLGFEGRPIATITTDEINGFLDSIPHPTTRSSHAQCRSSAIGLPANSGSKCGGEMRRARGSSGCIAGWPCSPPRALLCVKSMACRKQQSR